MKFPRKEYWSGLPFRSPRDLPNPGIETPFPVSPALAEDSLLLSHQIYAQLIHFAVHLKLTQYCKPTIDVKSLSRVRLFAAPWTVAY